MKLDNWQQKIKSYVGIVNKYEKISLIKSMSGLGKVSIIMAILGYIYGIVAIDILHFKYWYASLLGLPFFFILRFKLYHYFGFAKPYKKEIKNDKTNKNMGC